MAKDSLKAVNNPSYLGAMIANQQYQANQGLPNDYDVDAELFGNIKKQFGGEKPRGVDALISGFATGAEYGSKMKGIGLRKEELAKYNKVMDYFMAANMEAEKANKKHQETQEKLLQIQPLADMAYKVNHSKLPENQQNEFFTDLVQQAVGKGLLPEGSYFLNKTPTNDVLYFNPQTGKKEHFDFSPAVSKGAMDEVELEMKMNLENQKLALQQQGLGIQQGRLDLEKQFAPQKYEAAQSRIEETSRRNDIMEGRLGESGFKRIEAAKQKYLPKIEAAGRVERIVNKIEPIIKLYPEALQSVLNVVWNNNDEGVIAGAIKALAQQATDGKTAEAIAELGKYTSELKIGAVKGLNNPNQFIDKIIAATVPGKSMPPKSFLKILNDMKEQAQFDRKLNSDYLNDSMPSYGEEAPNYGDKYGKIIEDFAAKKIPKEESQNPIASLSTEDLLARKQQLMGTK